MIFYTLQSERFGHFTLVSRFIQRMGLEKEFARHFATDPRSAVSQCPCSEVLLRSIVVER
jgi:hypothetical protein